MTGAFDIDRLEWHKAIAPGGVETDESLGWGNGLVVRSAFYRMSAGMQLPPHSHRGWVQVTVLKGEIEYEAKDRSKRRITAGSSYFVTPDEEHYESAPGAETVLLITHAFMPGSDLVDA